MIVTLKRRAAFSAAHNYNLPDLTEAQNRALFGGYAAQEGHGHNYRVEIDATGPVDERTGMVVNITQIDRILREKVIHALDGKFLNREVEPFRSQPPTTENITLFVRDRLMALMPEPAVLTGVTVWETDTISARWTSERAIDTMLTLTRTYDFSASHRLHSVHLSDEENLELFGKCNNPNGHGHNYEIEVTMAGTPDERSGMIYPLEALDAAVEETVLLPLDHKHLNLDIPDFADVNPTSEMLAVVIWRRLAKRLPTSGNPRLASVLVRETARNSFVYSGE
jgi:6-pyruvoyltetrahydropterin/6-carboxytetrahydropterin synthase